MRSAMVLLLALVVWVSGCGADSEPTGTVTDDGSATTAGDDEAAVEEAFEDVTAACRDRDRDRLQDRLSDALADRLRDRDREGLFGPEGTEIELVSRSVEIEGDTATVTAVFEVTLDGETTEVERTWEFERTDDGTWQLAAVPDCPLRD